MDFIQSLDPRTVIILVAAALILGFVLFAKFIKGVLKLAIIAALAVGVLYVLHRAGIL